MRQKDVSPSLFFFLDLMGVQILCDTMCIFHCLLHLAQVISHLANVNLDLTLSPLLSN